MSDSYRFPDVSLGRRDVRLPDRRIPPRGRRGTQASGTASRTRPATTGSTARRATSPATTTGGTSDDVALMSRARPQRLPLQHCVEPRSIRRERARSTRRASISIRASSTSFSRTASSPTHALPLGSARGARRPRRLAQPRHRRLVRRLRARRCSTRWATASDVVDAQRAVGRHGRRLPVRRARARPLAICSKRRSLLTTFCARTAPAVERFRATKRRSKGKIGLVVNLEPKYPASESPEDLAAVQRADAYMNRQYLDPVFLGKYPGGDAGHLRRGVAGLVRRRHAAHQAADRLPRRQLLHAQRRALSSPNTFRCVPSTCRSRSTLRPRRIGKYFPRR